MQYVCTVLSKFLMGEKKSTNCLAGGLARAHLLNFSSFLLLMLKVFTCTMLVVGVGGIVNGFSPFLS